MKPSRSFASDNNAVVHPEVLEAIRRANEGHAVGYGNDSFTASAVGKFREEFGADVAVFFVFNGTAANVLSLQALTRPFHAVLCPELSHIYTDECGAPEKLTGCKLIPLPAPNGKLTTETVSQAYHGIGDQHHVQPRVISITQSTEMGTVYKPQEIVAEEFLFLRKQGMQLASKMRFMSAQMEALLTNELWRRNAEHANRMAQLLEQEVTKIPRVKVVYPVEANGVFAQIPEEAIARLQERYFFYVWSEGESVVRWMCSFDTTEEDVREFAQFVKTIVSDG
jgi:threonine aldolase